jgi:type I restriction enzyme S subunit
LNPRKNFILNSFDSKNYYVSIKNMDGRNINLTKNTDRVNDAAIKLINARSNLEKDDILFSGIGTVGITAYIDETPKN